VRRLDCAYIRSVVIRLQFIRYSNSRVTMFSFETEEDEACELVRACRALHCPLCDTLFSSNEDDQRAPLILMCGHSICRACLADGLSRLWNAHPDDEDDGDDDGSGNKRPPCTCPECGESFAPGDDQATLPFFNAALACTVLQLQSLAKGLTFTPGAAPVPSTPAAAATSSEAESSKETSDVAVQTDEDLEEEYARQRWMPSDSIPAKESSPDSSNGDDAPSKAAAANDDAHEEAGKPSKPQSKVSSTNPFECDSPRDPNVPLPTTAPKAAEGTVSAPPSKRFSYFPVVIDRVAMHEHLSQWVARYVIPPLLPGVSALRVHVSKDSPRVLKVVQAAEAAMIPVFVPFLSFSLMACINGREVYRDEKKNSQQFVTCAWELHSGRDAVNETIDPLLWKQHQLRLCDPDERPRPGLWLPASTQNSDTLPKAMPRMPALRTEAVVSPFAQELDKETRAEHESELVSCPHALTVRVVKPVLFYAPFWMASVKLPEFCAIVVNALNGKVVGSSTPLFDIVRDAKKEHKSSVDADNQTQN